MKLDKQQDIPGGTDRRNSELPKGRSSRARCAALAGTCVGPEIRLRGE